MKLVIHTQHRENYGAHAWDGKGECPQGWKNKGGDIYVIHGVSVDNAQSEEWYNAVADAIESADDYFEEYIISYDLIDEYDYDPTELCEEWETPYDLTFVAGKLLGSCRTFVEFHDEIKFKREEFVMRNGHKDDYKLSYELADGSIVSYKEWCDRQEVA